MRSASQDKARAHPQSTLEPIVSLVEATGLVIQVRRMMDTGSALDINQVRKPKKKKVLLMGKSGSGKSSMRSIIFSNYVAKDTRRLGATIDVEYSNVKFLGNLTLNLWDCGGQDAFMESYLVAQRKQVFSNVGVLIYVFDVESREFERDLITYSSIIRALKEYSPYSTVFCLIHKMDLIQPIHRERLFEERISFVRERSEGFEVTAFATSIWDQTLYKAWAGIMYILIPNIDVIDDYLAALLQQTDANEIVLFERTTFLVVTSVMSERGNRNAMGDRFEKLSNIIKTFKHSAANYTELPSASSQFSAFELKMPRFSLFITALTDNTYLLVVLPPGDSKYNVAQYNVTLAMEDFAKLDIIGEVRRREPRGGYADPYPNGQYMYDEDVENAT
ncbi:MAG: hypothetical protein M1812_000286 [Candelaria pacifica]|nr:MAG: hypothetical protein M1812_000286 [Candelaria pacifica]